MQLVCSGCSSSCLGSLRSWSFVPGYFVIILKGISSIFQLGMIPIKMAIVALCIMLTLHSKIQRKQELVQNNIYHIKLCEPPAAFQINMNHFKRSQIKVNTEKLPPVG